MDEPQLLPQRLMLLFDPVMGVQAVHEDSLVKKVEKWTAMEPDDVDQVGGIVDGWQHRHTPCRFQARFAHHGPVQNVHLTIKEKGTGRQASLVKTLMSDFQNSSRE